MHLGRETHTALICYKRPSDLNSGHISALISGGIALSGHGQMSDFMFALRAFVDEKLVVYHHVCPGGVEAVEYRERMLDLFLGQPQAGKKSRH